MIIRDYRPEDRERLEEIHRAQGFQYSFPDLEDEHGEPVKNYFIKLVGVDENGKIVAGAIAHLTAEIYFLLDPEDGTPTVRMERFEKMEEAGRAVAWYPGGLDDLHALVPPRIEKSFGKRLLRRGWFRNTWPCFSREL